MSVFEDAELTCPRCGAKQVTSLAVSVNGERSRHLRDAILAGGFQQIPCPACGAVTPADGPLLYVEVGARRFIGCQPRGWEPAWRELEADALDTWRRTFIDHAPETVRRLSSGFVVRTVFGLHALREKLVCFDAGLDDRLVAVLVLDLMRTPGGPLVMTAAGRPTLVEADGERLVFAVAGGGVIAVPRARYDAIADDTAKWGDAIRRVSAGPYVDVGRLLIPGTAPRPG